MTEKKKAEKKRQVCPYCEEEIAEATFPYCQVCQVELFHCPSCHQPLATYEEICPSCGVNIREEVRKES